MAMIILSMVAGEFHFFGEVKPKNLKGRKLPKQNFSLAKVIKTY